MTEEIRRGLDPDVDDERTRSERHLRYLGDGSAGVAGHPADPDVPEFFGHLTDKELDRLEATGLYEEVS